MSKHKKNKPFGEIIAGLIITGASAFIGILSFVDFPNNADALYYAIPSLIVGLVVLLSKDATKAGDKIFKYLGGL